MPSLDDIANRIDARLDVLEGSETAWKDSVPWRHAAKSRKGVKSLIVDLVLNCLGK